jgi:hypothetical protein
MRQGWAGTRHSLTTIIILPFIGLISSYSGKFIYLQDEQSSNTDMREIALFSFKISLVCILSYVKVVARVA